MTKPMQNSTATRLKPAEQPSTTTPCRERRDKSWSFSELVRDTFVFGLLASAGQAAAARPKPVASLHPKLPGGTGTSLPSGTGTTLPNPADTHLTGLSQNHRNLLWRPYDWPATTSEPLHVSPKALHLAPREGIDGVVRLYGDEATTYFLSNDNNFCRHLKHGQRMQKHRFAVVHVSPRLWETPGEEVDPGWPLHDISAMLFEHSTACKLRTYARYYNQTVIYNYDGNLGDFITLMNQEEAMRLEEWMWIGMKVRRCHGFVPDADDTTAGEDSHDPRLNMRIYGPHNNQRCVPAPQDKPAMRTYPLY